MPHYQEDAHAPPDWSCEECDIGYEIMSSHEPKNRVSGGSTIQATEKNFHSSVQPKKPSNFPGRQCIEWEKGVRTGKTRYLPVKEALFLSSGIKKYGSPLKTTGSSKLLSPKSMATVSRLNFSNPKTQATNSFPEKSKVQHSAGAAGCLKPRSPRNTQISELSKKPVQLSKGHTTSTFLEPRSPDAVNASQKIIPPEVYFPGHTASTVLEPRSPDAGNASQKNIPPEAHPCDPALNPSWTGIFDIFGDLNHRMLSNQIQACHPAKVTLAVYELSTLLPDTLQFELFPRGDIWTSLFHDYFPGKEDIGLYFFANEGKRSKMFFDLVKHVSTKDFVMRSHINETELLVFASTVLRSDSQQWDGKHFLWGLFRDTDDGCAEEGGNSEEIDMEIDMSEEDVNDVDMDIDMLAGENVGRVDVCVSTSRNGFERHFTESATADSCDGSESVALTHVSKDGGKGVGIKREPDACPPGFVPR